MQTEKMLVRTEAVYSDDRTRRYLLHREWDVKKPKALIIMTNPSTAGTIALDFTTMYILNNITALGYGSVTTANLVSKITLRLSVKDDIEAEDENFDQIVKAAQKADKVIIAWGRIGETSVKVRAVQDKLLARLEPFKEKLCEIGNESGESGFHPLAPQIRSHWILNPYEIPEPIASKEEKQPKPKVKRKSKSQEAKAADTDDPCKSEQDRSIPSVPDNITDQQPQKEAAK
ncbi:DUF1643 domain-containing protein [Pyramidobacter sp. SM-530-WT-4B]|uniref:DUF1643 domain-containing protein n=1 Tax=Pyramidobacter porci TaxID=2605789 RepID=A0A6L5YDJ5_9BACT|nr:DUF1643 domain-containing protein [Pyramidobacter porci]MST55657.1 DUF1643 domain-containing protein [Pyramidobacter porci]